MEALRALPALLAPGRTLRPVEDGIWSALAEPPSGRHRYDRWAAVYDALVGRTWYNRLMWGCTPREYAAFARDALAARGHGWHLDAAGGSLLFSADAYAARDDRPVVVLDESLAMLRRARDRLRRRRGAVPAHVVLLQGDLRAPPFRAASFATTLCMCALHLFDDAAGVLRVLGRGVAPGGALYCTSLVLSDRWLPDHYLWLLHRAGELAGPRRGVDVAHALSESGLDAPSVRTRRSMAFGTATKAT